MAQTSGEELEMVEEPMPAQNIIVDQWPRHG